MRKIIILVLALICCTKNNDINNSSENNIIEKKKYIEVFGIVKAKEKMSINVDFNAKIDDILVKEGEYIKKGDVLLVLSFKDYRLLIKNKEYELLQAKFKLEELKLEMIKILNDIEIYKEKLELLSAELERKKNLLDVGGIPVVDVEECQKEVNENRKNLENFEITLKKYNNLDSNLITLQQKKIETVRFEINEYKRNILKNNIIGNNLVCIIENGIIEKINYSPGDYVNFEIPILSIIDLDSIIIEAEVPEEFFSEVNIGKEAEIIPVSNKDKLYKGKITGISNMAINKNSETIIKVEITINNNIDGLIPNQNVDVKINI